MNAMTPNQNTAVRSEGGKSPNRQPAVSAIRLLSLAQELQQDLDVEAVLQRFSRQLALDVPHSSIAFSSEEGDAQVVMGIEKSHRLEYEIVLNGERLGMLTLTHRRPLPENATLWLETFMAYLGYPLRNALLYQRAQDSAIRDSLTGVRNRRTLDESLRREMSLARRQGTDLSLMLVDVDHFKEINDSFGHDAGDRVLKAVADAIQQTVRDSDLVFRYGGDEFVVVMPGSDARGAEEVAHRLRQAVKDLTVGKGNARVMIQLSLGVAQAEKSDCDDSFFDRADAALYRAKRAGRNQVARCSAS